MIVYNYDPATGIFLGSEDAIESPLEPGVFLVPAHATVRTPPPAQEGKIIVFTGQDWELHDIPTQPAPEPFVPTWDDIRLKRNFLLSQFDWTQAADAPLSPDQVAAWKTYRQTLRDIPQKNSNPAEVVWPTAP